MNVGKKVLIWGILMSFFFFMTTIFAIFSYRFDESTISLIFIILSCISLTLFMTIYVFVPLPFRDLLLKAMTVLNKKDFCYFDTDLKVLLLITNILIISSKKDKVIQEYYHNALLDLSSEEKDQMNMETKKKTKFKNPIIILNVGLLITLIGLIFMNTYKNNFLSNMISPVFFEYIICLLFYLRYSYNACIIFILNKKLIRISQSPGITYQQIRDD